MALRHTDTHRTQPPHILRQQMTKVKMSVVSNTARDQLSLSVIKNKMHIKQGIARQSDISPLLAV